VTQCSLVTGLMIFIISFDMNSTSSETLAKNIIRSDNLIPFSDAVMRNDLSSSVHPQVGLNLTVILNLPSSPLFLLHYAKCFKRDFIILN
jgi:hypothetical protein